MSDYNDYLLPEPCLRLDFGFGEQYLSIELGDGTGYLRLRGSEDRETELRERIASLNVENVDLDVENAKLREQAEFEHSQLEDMRTAVGMMLDEHEGLIAENAKLREELAKARDPQRIGGQADPSSFFYAIEQLREFRWQHATNDEDAIPYINNVAAAHERENTKLRELVWDMRYNSTWTDEAREYIDGVMRELGIEAPE